MSNPESFIDEVSEEVRRDKLYALMRRYGWIGIVAVVALVGGAAYNEWRKATEQAQAEATGDAVLAAISLPEAAERVAALQAVDTEGAARAVLDLLAAAEAEGDSGRPVLEAVADNEALPRLYRDMAVMKLVLLPGAGTPDDRIARLTPLTDAGAPYRVLAEEQIALAEIEAGRSAEALDRLQQIWLDQEASAALRQRAGEMIVALGGTPGAA